VLRAELSSSVFVVFLAFWDLNIIRWKKERRKDESRKRRATARCRKLGNDSLSSLRFKSEAGYEIFHAVSAWRAWRLFPIYIGDHTSHIFNTICVFSLRDRECAIIEPRARLRGNCTLWVIACDKCPECPTFLRDVNGLDLGHRARATHRAGIYSLLSISHACPTRRRVVEKRLWAKLNLHKRPRLARPARLLRIYARLPGRKSCGWKAVILLEEIHLLLTIMHDFTQQSRFVADLSLS